MRELSFTLTCACGEEVSGAFFEDDFKEELTCGCGLVWVIPRPYETESGDKDA